MRFEIKGLDHVQLAAPTGSESEARHFFADVLGMKQIEKPESLRKNGGVWFKCGNQEIHIGIEDPFKPAKKAHPAFEIIDLDELRSFLIDKGYEVKDDDRLPYAKRFYVSDPFGNRLEFLEYKTSE